MATKIDHLAPRLPAKLHRVLEARFDGDPRATNLCTEFLSREEYDRPFGTSLLAISDGSAGDSWNIRLFATLMLANQCRRLDPDNEEEFKFLFSKLGILSPDGKRMDDGLLREGYTSTNFRVFYCPILRQPESPREDSSKNSGASDDSRRPRRVHLLLTRSV